MGAPVMIEKAGNEGLFLEAMDLLFESAKEAKSVDDDDYWVDSIEMDDLIEHVRGMVEDEWVDRDRECTPGMDSSSDCSPGSLTKNGMKPSVLKELDACFKSCDARAIEDERRAEFQLIEAFIKDEQDANRKRRSTARLLEAGEEKRLAAEVAQLRGVRLKSKRINGDDDLRWKISHAEALYINRKMVFAKASQLASADLRLQFNRVRKFLEELHKKRQQVLYHKHRRSLNFQTLMHILKGSDPRMISLDTQISVRLFRKQKGDLNELHMARTLEEALFLDSMENVVDEVQRCKETAAREMFNLHVQNLKDVRNNNERRNDELELLASAGTLEMAKLVAQYTAEDQEDQEEQDLLEENVQAIERGKDFKDMKDQTETITKLYDTIVWNAANNDLGLTTTGSSLFSSDYGSMQDDDEGDDKEDGDVKEDEVGKDGTDGYPVEPEDEHEDNLKCPTPTCAIHARQLAREIREKEKQMVAKHEKEIKAEKRVYRKACQALKTKHQVIIDEVVASSGIEREKLRESISERLEMLEQHQQELTVLMRKKDIELMKEALFAEDQRVEDAEQKSFRKAHELISAQCFHEIRNALSSVVAMAEMTNAMRTDDSMSPKELIGSVDDMLDQVGDVVNYSLKMLNEMLDLSKINSGVFTPKNEAFDLQDILSRATRMQVPKASKISLSFHPSPEPCIAVSDPAIVERVTATLISNAVKFTPHGAVQPFVVPLELMPEDDPEKIPEATSLMHQTTMDTATTAPSTVLDASGSGDTETDDDMLSDSSSHSSKSLVRYVAVGVADTGIGLTREKLEAAKHGIASSSPQARLHGAENTGFGIHHAHLQTRALGTQLFMANIEDCGDFLNGAMLDALAVKKSSTSPRHLRQKDQDGQGTVIYFVVPVCSEEARQSMKKSEDSALMVQAKREYVFRPMPSPHTSGAFRILVADDVVMLRKGMVNTIGELWKKHFRTCPVSVSTACSAEDMLRAARSEPFDMIISDHHFHPSNPPQLEGKKRKFIQFNDGTSSSGETRTAVKEFFDNEEFTKEDDDGTLLGQNALTNLARWSSSQFPTPILMLVSGHKIDLEPSLGIIVVQKPLKQSDFIASLERRAVNLLAARKVANLQP